MAASHRYADTKVLSSSLEDGEERSKHEAAIRRMRPLLHIELMELFCTSCLLAVRL